MKILLTGASGYIGSELLLELLAAGHEPVCVTRADTAQHTSAVRRVVHDLREPLTLPDTDFDLIIHAAGANDVASRDPAAALTLTALTTRQVAEFASRQRQPRLLYVSTFQVYGRDEGSVAETTPCCPKNDYALTHLFAEQWVEQYGRTHGLAWINVRPANIAGVPRRGRMERWTLVPGCFCYAAQQDQQIVVRSTGLQQRDFLPVTEVARRIVHIADHFFLYADSAINLCSGTTLSIGDVAKMAAARYTEITGKPCPVSFAPHPGSNREPAPRLVINSRHFDKFPDGHLSQEQAVAMMDACIDQTYAHLRDRAPQS